MQTVPADWLDRVRSLCARGQFGRAMRSLLIDVVGLTSEQVALLRENVGGDDPIPIVEKTMVREAEALKMYACRTSPQRSFSLYFYYPELRVRPGPAP